MKHLLQQHKILWLDTAFLVSVIIGIVLLAGSMLVNYEAGTYASAHQSSAVSDIILDHIPTFHVEDIFIEGFYIFVLFIVAVLFSFPHYIPFTIKSIALFVFIRSFFIILTHIGPALNVTQIDPGYIFQKVNFTGDLFFSGHTGLPFLMMLIFWHHKKIRLLFLFSSILFGVTVLLGHLHYSIDVFGAFFITFTIFEIAKKVFAKDWKNAHLNTPSIAL